MLLSIPEKSLCGCRLFLLCLNPYGILKKFELVRSTGFNGKKGRFNDKKGI
jgi:hypothetical protein